MVINFQKIKKWRLWYLLLPPEKKIYCFVSPKQNILTDLYTSSFISSLMELTMMEFREVLCFPREKPYMFWFLSFFFFYLFL